ncbi:hypothetical protein PybrP1_006246 [[Pythium] brassicae (nom. inval.)]|nr:hypothetical protein PybrP1_006246 [[Pythium] brassicae (nom. inval.)]
MRVIPIDRPQTARRARAAAAEPPATTVLERLRAGLAGLQSARRSQGGDAVDSAVFADNVVVSAKYTAFNFLPRVLLAQVQRPSNMYFLFIAVLQTIKDVSNTNGVPTILLPLTFVFVCSAIKEALEDRERHRADAVMNSQSVLWLSAEGAWERRQWGEIRVGDVVKVLNDETVPADLFMLSAEELEDSTMDADAFVAASQSRVHTEATGAMIECEPPNNRIATFDGTFALSLDAPQAAALGIQGPADNEDDDDDALSASPARTEARSTHLHVLQQVTRSPDGSHWSVRVPITAKQMVLRSCVLRNTRAVVGVAIFTGHETKVFCSNTDPVVKTSSVEQRLNALIIGVVCIQQLVCLLGALLGALWMVSQGNAYWYLHGAAPSTTALLLPAQQGGFPFRELLKLHLRYFIIMQNFHYGGEVLGDDEDDDGDSATQPDGATPFVHFDPTALFADLRAGGTHATRIQLFLRHLALCHTLIPAKPFAEMCASATPEYSASSPDEQALVAAAAHCNVRFVHRTPSTLALLEPGFAGPRRLAAEQASDAASIDDVYAQLSQYAKCGMRTLCIAHKTIDRAEYDEWNRRFAAAMASMDELVASDEYVAVAKGLQEVAMRQERLAAMSSASKAYAGKRHFRGHQRQARSKPWHERLRASVRTLVLGAPPTTKRTRSRKAPARSSSALTYSPVYSVGRDEAGSGADDDGFEDAALLRGGPLAGLNGFGRSAPPSIALVIDGKALENALRPRLRPLFYQTNVLLARRVFWPWIFNGIWHSLIIFFVSAWGFQGDLSVSTQHAALHHPVTVSSSGHEGGLVTLGFVVFTNLVIVVNLKLVLETFLVTWHFMTTVLASIALWFGVGALLASPTSHFRHAVGEMTFLLRMPAFWALCLLVVTLSLLRDLLWKIVRRMHFPSTYHILQEREKLRMANSPRSMASEYKAIMWPDVQVPVLDYAKVLRQLPPFESAHESFMRSSPLAESLISSSSQDADGSRHIRARASFHVVESHDDAFGAWEHDQELHPLIESVPGVAQTPLLGGGGSGSAHGAPAVSDAPRHQYHGYAFSQDENVDSDVEAASASSSKEKYGKAPLATASGLVSPLRPGSSRSFKKMLKSVRGQKNA